jgi:DNA-binding transcriptional LysR family regulator
MELRHLRYFVAAAETLNITKAAARLRVAQPALSRQLQDLEDEIGVDLFNRSPRGIALTAEGRLCAEAAREILRRVEGMVERTRALGRGEAGELRVGYSPSPTIELLPPALAEFRRAAPGVALRLHDLAGNELWSGLREGALELAVSSRPQDDSMAGLKFELLRTYPIGVAMAPSHPLARKREVSQAALAAQTLVVFRRREYTDYHRMLRRVFGPSLARMRIGAECDGAGTLFTELESGEGVAVLPQVFAKVAGPRLRFRALTPAPPLLEVGIITAEDGDVTPAGERLCALLRQRAKAPAQKK